MSDGVLLFFIIIFAFVMLLRTIHASLSVYFCSAGRQASRQADLVVYRIHSKRVVFPFLFLSFLDVVVLLNTLIY